MISININQMKIKKINQNVIVDYLCIYHKN